MGITEVLTVAGEMLCSAGKALGLVSTLEISTAHLRNALCVITEGAGKNFGAFPVISYIANGSKSHGAADSGSLCAGNAAHCLGIIKISCCADLNACADKGSVRAGTVAAVFGVAGNHYGYLGILLQSAVLLKHHSAGHSVIANTAYMILLHQRAQILFVNAGGKLKEKLTNLLPSVISAIVFSTHAMSSSDR